MIKLVKSILIKLNEVIKRDLKRKLHYLLIIDVIVEPRSMFSFL